MLFTRIICTILASYALLGYSTNSLAWGPDGHTTIGILAMGQLTPEARGELESMIGPLNEEAMQKACNWPDAVRETEEWEWSAPQHYVNIPRDDFSYLKSRDCPDGRCVTEAIKHYAAELTSPQIEKEQRWQAFAWLCHVVGDLHQPLHAGFADDRGGNDFGIVFKGEQLNLHRFWDSELINQYADSWQSLFELLNTNPVVQADANWSPEMVDGWTNNSHQLASEKLYPATEKIDEAYVQKSWVLAQQQLRLAASRLALIINTELQGEN